MQRQTKAPDRSAPLSLNTHRAKGVTKLRLLLLLGAVTACVCVAVVLWSWWQSPKRRVHRLVREVLNTPAGFSLEPQMSNEAIDEEYERLGARAIPPLIDLLQHEHSGFRRIAALYLGKRGDARAVVPLIRLLSDPDEIVRSFAARALGKLGDPRASAPLLNTLMHDTDERVRVVAARSLGHVGYSKDPKVVSALIELLETGTMRASAASSLGRLKDRAAVPALEKALDDHDPGVRREAALALVRLGVNSGIDELLVALGDSAAAAGYPMKVIIIQALADVADQRVKAALDRIASSDQSPAVRDAARRALMPR